MNLGWREKCHSWCDILWLAPCGDSRVGRDTFPADITLLIGKTFGPSSAYWDLSKQWNLYTLLCMIKMVSSTSWVSSPRSLFNDPSVWFLRVCIGLCKIVLVFPLKVFPYFFFSIVHIIVECVLFMRNLIKWILHWSVWLCLPVTFQKAEIIMLWSSTLTLFELAVMHK